MSIVKKAKLIAALQKKKKFDLYCLLNFLLLGKGSLSRGIAPSENQLQQIVDKTNLVRSELGGILIPWMNNKLLGVVMYSQLPEFLKGLEIK
jgi:hypothetical protein